MKEERLNIRSGCTRLRAYAVSHGVWVEKVVSAPQGVRGVGREGSRQIERHVLAERIGV